MGKVFDYNIEFAHIYVNENFSPEQQTGAQLALEKVGTLRRRGRTVTMGVLIDDYNPNETFLDWRDLVKRLAEIGAKPDFVGSEARLTVFKDQLLESIEDRRIQKEYLRYIGKNEKIPCSFLIAVWHLLRLSEKLMAENENFLLVGDSKRFVARKLITILPARFQSVEEKAKRIVTATRFVERIEDLEYIFF